MNRHPAHEPESLQAKLAKLAVELWVNEKQYLEVASPLPVELLFEAGCFVSLKIGNDLRGCIGTIEPERPNLGLEIVHNAIAAATHDPRFYPVRHDELAFVSYSVDVLSAPERVASLADQDPVVHGLIVEARGRRGVLLPDIEGVTSAEQQLEICLSKASISFDLSPTLYRFTVNRYN